MQIVEIKKIKLDNNDKLMVRLPNGTSPEAEAAARESLIKFFNISPNRLLIYQGDVEFEVVN